jgi:DNA-binding NarL/FixJ family response regulator
MAWSPCEAKRRWINLGCGFIQAPSVLRVAQAARTKVLPLMVGGILKKQAAAVSGISVGTLQVHRGQIMCKMAVDAFADLVRAARQPGIRYRPEDYRK